MTPLVFSASQFEAYARCHRLWWFQRVAKLPTRSSSAQTFGTVFAKVVERWLKDLDPFLPGWAGDLYPADQDLIKRLLSKAIDKGVLKRNPKQWVEAEIWMDLLAEEGEFPAVKLQGFIDVAHERGIDDHKTTKSLKWAKTPEQLRQNTQLLVYAKAWLEDRRMDKIPDPPNVEMRHHYYVKDAYDPQVETRAADPPLTPREIDEAWEELRRQSAKMRLLPVLKAPKDDVQAQDIWPTVEAAGSPSDARTRRGACGDYGGCEFAELCGGGQSIADYRREFDRIRDKREWEAQGLPTEGERMVNPLFANRMGVVPSASAPTTTPSAPPVVPFNGTAPATMPNTTVGTTTPIGNKITYPVWDGAPPWTRNDCTACATADGSGIKRTTGVTFKRGDACRICSNNNQAEGKIPSTLYEVGYQNGEFWWQVKADFQDKVGDATGGSLRLPWMSGAATPAPAPSTPATTPAPTPTPATSTPTQPAASQAPPATTAAATTATTATTTETAEAAEKRTRKGKGFTLLVNARLDGPSNQVVRLEEVFTRRAAEMAKEQGADSYFHLDAFKRRDQMCAHAEAIIEAENFGTKFVLASTSGSPDMKMFIETLRGLAGTVIEGVSA